MTVRIVIGKTKFEFLEKNNNRTCEIVDTDSKKQFEGFITSVSTNGTYLVEVGKEIEGARR